MPYIQRPTEQTAYLAPKPKWRIRLWGWLRRQPKWMHLKANGELVALSRREAKRMGLH